MMTTRSNNYEQGEKSSSSYNDDQTEEYSSESSIDMSSDNETSKNDNRMSKTRSNGISVLPKTKTIAPNGNEDHIKSMKQSHGVENSYLRMFSDESLKESVGIDRQKTGNRKTLKSKLNLIFVLRIIVTNITVVISSN